MHQKERRNTIPKSNKELYKRGVADKFIKRERRGDEIDKIIEVKQQKAIWRNTLIFCLLLNLTLIILAIIGL